MNYPSKKQLYASLAANNNDFILMNELLDTLKKQKVYISETKKNIHEFKLNLLRSIKTTVREEMIITLIDTEELKNSLLAQTEDVKKKG